MSPLLVFITAFVAFAGIADVGVGKAEGEAVSVGVGVDVAIIVGVGCVVAGADFLLVAIIIPVAAILITVKTTNTITRMFTMHYHTDIAKNVKISVREEGYRALFLEDSVFLRKTINIRKKAIRVSANAAPPLFINSFN